MKTKTTPEYVLDMLRELKKATDEKKFDYKTFKKKYPTYSVYRIFLFSKGLMKKEYGYNHWISIEPNIIMAKELLKLYNEYVNQVKIRQLKRKEALKDSQQKEDVLPSSEIVPETITDVNPILNIPTTKTVYSDLLSRFEEKNEEIDSVNRKYNQLQEELINLRAVLSNERQDNVEYRKFFFDYEYLPLEYERLKGKLTNQETANESYKKRIFEAENDITQNVKTYREKLSDLQQKIENQKEKIEKQNKKILDLQEKLKVYKHEEIMSAPQPDIEYPYFPDFPEPDTSTQEGVLTAHKGSRTYKILGIPVFSINNK